MGINIINIVHAVLMDNIDGSIADDFLWHVSRFNDFQYNPVERYPEWVQVRWMTTYWIIQLSNAEEDFRDIEISLLACTTMPEFVSVFSGLVLPSIEHYNISILNDVCMVPLSTYAIEGVLNNGG